MKIFSQYVRSALLLAAVSNGAVLAAYCEDDSCWPSASEWADFKTVVNDKLVAIDPPLKPCAGGKNTDVCVDLFTKSSDASWISSQPGGYAYPVFTQNADSKMCFLHSMSDYDAFQESGTCNQGSISSYGVAVTTEAEIATTLAFAAKNNLQVVVKNSGLDLQGRSIASKYALMIWLNDFTGVEIMTDFTACSSDATAVPAVVVRGGARWGDVYSTVKAASYHVVGDAVRSVGAAGGWVQGGGHSFSSAALGLGVDNVLKFGVVLTSGDVVEASPCANADLFWALRGGGGGTFGIVTSVAYKLHAEHTVTGYQFDLTFAASGARTDLLATLLTWVAAQTGEVVVGGSPILYGEQLGGKLTGQLVINGNLEQAQTLLGPLQTKIDDLLAQGALTGEAPALTEKASFLDWYDEAFPANNADPVGTLSNSVSRLIPISLCAQPADLVKVLDDYATTYPFFRGKIEIVAGGAVSTADTDSSQTSVSPSWRDSCVHLVVTDLEQAIVSILPSNIFASTNEESVTKVQAVSTMGGALRVVAGADRGADFAESDYIESDWKSVFWGNANYDKLLAAKKKYDPKLVLSCHHCIGEGEVPEPAATPAPAATTPAPAEATPAPAATTPAPAEATPAPAATTPAPAATTPAPAATTPAPAATTPAPATMTPAVTTAVPTNPEPTTTPVPTTDEPATAVPTTTTTDMPTKKTANSTTTNTTPVPTSVDAAQTSGSASAFALGGFTFPMLLAVQAVLLGSWFFFRNQ